MLNMLSTTSGKNYSEENNIRMCYNKYKFICHEQSWLMRLHFIDTHNWPTYNNAQKAKKRRSE